MPQDKEIVVDGFTPDDYHLAEMHIWDESPFDFSEAEGFYPLLRSVSGKVVLCLVTPQQDLELTGDMPPESFDE
jgi:hypothetical protein